MATIPISCGNVDSCPRKSEGALSEMNNGITVATNPMLMPTRLRPAIRTKTVGAKELIAVPENSVTNLRRQFHVTFETRKSSLAGTSRNVVLLAKQ